MILVKNRIRNKGLKRNAKINESHKHKVYKIGDKVLVKALNVSNAAEGIFSKFLAIYEGPYVIAESYNDTTFLLKNTDASNRGKFHGSLLRPYNGEGKGDDKDGKIPSRQRN